MQKIAADKVHILECYPESPLVTIQFFPKSKIYLSMFLCTDHGTLRKIGGLEAFL